MNKLCKQLNENFMHFTYFNKIVKYEVNMREFLRFCNFRFFFFCIPVTPFPVEKVLFFTNTIDELYFTYLNRKFSQQYALYKAKELLDSNQFA